MYGDMKVVIDEKIPYLRDALLAMGFDVVNFRAFFSGICTTAENLEMPEIISD